MKPQHTPGEWTIARTTRPDGLIPITNSCGLGIAAVAMPADAQLVASAPDLLSALQNLVKHFNEHWELEVDATQKERESLAKARQAIAEATGEQ